MKKSVNLCTLILTLCLLVAMSLPSFAATITVTGQGATSQYEGYRLLNLTTAGSGDATKYTYTVNPEYRTLLVAVLGITETYPTDGSNAEKAAYDKIIVDAIAAIENADVQAFADNLYQGIDDTDGLKTETYSADLTGTAQDGTASLLPDEGDAPQGYYLIAEISTSSPDVYSLVMLDTLGQANATVNTKEKVPTVVKKVADATVTEGTTLTYTDAVSAATGETVTFKITVSLPSEWIDFSDYDAYKLSIIDTMPDHLTFVSGSAKVMYGEYDVTQSFQQSETGLTFTCNDIKHINIAEQGEDPEYLSVSASGSFVLTYEALVAQSSVIGGTGEINTVKINYSASPYDSTKSSESSSDPAQVFGFQLIVNKVDTNSVPLAGAKFKLYNDSKSTANQIGNEIEAVAVYDTTDSNKVIAYTATFEALDEGTYVLEESTHPTGYAAADDITFTISATYTDGTGTAAGKKVISTLTTDNSNITVINAADGVLSTTVQNARGSALPSTGSTALVILIGVAAVCAVIGLTARKKREN